MYVFNSIKRSPTCDELSYVESTIKFAEDFEVDGTSQFSMHVRNAHYFFQLKSFKFLKDFGEGMANMSV